MRALGLHDSLMYGGYETPATAGRRGAADPDPRRAPAGVRRSASTRRPPTSPGSRAPSTSRRRGRGRCSRLGVSGSEARHLLWLLAQVPDRGKLGRFLGRRATLFHKAGWIPSARHDNGIVVTADGAFVAAVMTWRSGSADVLAGEVAREVVGR